MGRKNTSIETVCRFKGCGKRFSITKGEFKGHGSHGCCRAHAKHQYNGKRFSQSWAVRNPDKHTFRVNNYTQKTKFRLFKLLGNQCKKCHFKDWRALQIDHINGEGHRNERYSGVAYYLHVIKSVLAKDGKYQLLCANCNWIKKFKNREVGKKAVIKS